MKKLNQSGNAGIFIVLLIVIALGIWFVSASIQERNRWDAWTTQCTQRHGLVAIYRGTPDSGDYECYINGKPTILPGWAKYGDL